jgi:hypothetical protein
MLVKLIYFLCIVVKEKDKQGHICPPFVIPACMVVQVCTKVTLLDLHS